MSSFMRLHGYATLAPFAGGRRNLLNKRLNRAQEKL